MSRNKRGSAKDNVFPEGYEDIDQAINDIEDVEQELSNDERVRFLKEYSNDTTRTLPSVAAYMQIPQKSADAYLKKYIYLMINSASDHDNPRRARIILNEGVEKHKEKLTDYELIQLRPLIDRYGDIDIVNTMKAKQDLTLRLMKQKPSNAFGFNSMQPGYGPQQGPDFNYQQQNETNPYYTQPHQGYGPDGTGRDEKPFAKLSGSSRSNLLRWILHNSPHVHYTKIDPFINLFEANEMKLMSSPDELNNFMKNYFGPQAGGFAFSQFKDMINGMLAPNMQFGQNPYAPPQYQQGGWGSPGYGGFGNGNSVNFYEALGILPPGVDSRSPEARRAIYEYELDKKNKRVQEQTAEQIKNYVNIKMMEVLDPNKGGGMFGGNNMQSLLPLILSGNLSVSQGVGPDGKPVMNYAAGGGGKDQNESLAVQMMAVMNQMWQGVLNANNQLPNFLQPLFNVMFEKMSTNANPFSMAIEAKRLADSFNPPATTGVKDSIEVAKLLLAQKKIDKDAELTVQKMQYDHERDMYQQQKADRQEEANAEKTQNVVNSLFQIGGKAIGPLLQAFMMGRGGGAANMAAMMGAGGMGGGMPDGGGLGGMMGMPNGNGGNGGPGNGGGPPGGLGGMFGMGGPEVGPGGEGFDMMGSPVDFQDIAMRQETAARGNPQWYAEPSDLFGYGTNMPPPQPVYRPPTVQEQWAAYQDASQMQQPQPQYQPQQQQQPQQQPVEVIQEKKYYQPGDFDGLTAEQFAEYEMQGQSKRDTIDSFNNALRAAKQKRIFAQQNQAYIPEQVQAQMPQQLQPQQQQQEYQPVSKDDQLIQNQFKTINDPIEEAEQMFAANKTDLQVLPDTPMTDPPKEQKKEVVRSAMDDLADVV